MYQEYMKLVSHIISKIKLGGDVPCSENSTIHTSHYNTSSLSPTLMGFYCMAKRKSGVTCVRSWPHLLTPHLGEMQDYFDLKMCDKVYVGSLLWCESVNKIQK
jgi:hypothetical protein